MKKNNALSVVAIVGVILLVLGLIVGIIGFAMGGTFRWANAQWDENGFHWGWNEIGEGNSTYWSNLTDYNMTYENDAVTALDLTLFAGYVKIVVAEQGGYDIQNYPAGALRISFEGGTLRIKDTRSHYGNVTGDMYRNTNITIYITQNHLDSLKISMGVGRFDFENCLVDEFEQEMGVADSNLTGITANSYEAEGGVGSYTFRDCTLNDATIQAGVGDIDFEGRLTGDCKVTGGVGTMRFLLEGRLDDYYFNVTTGIGSVKIGDNQLGGIGHSDVHFGNSGSANRIQLETGIGDATFTFTQN